MSNPDTWNYPHTIAFRVTEDQYVTAEHLRRAFPNQTWAEVGRWMFSNPDIHKIIRERVKSGNPIERTTP